MTIAYLTISHIWYHSQMRDLRGRPSKLKDNDKEPVVDELDGVRGVDPAGHTVYPDEGEGDEDGDGADEMPCLAVAVPPEEGEAGVLEN